MVQMNHRLVTALVCGFSLLWVQQGIGQVDAELAKSYFAEAAELCQRDGGRLWGKPLYGPLALCDAQTNTIATNEPMPSAPRPKFFGFANTAADWGGQRWSSVVWKMVPSDPAARGRLLVHELFHRIQPELGLSVNSAAADNAHLDTLEGRYWIQLEWRALSAALQAPQDEQSSALSDALAFRQARRALFPSAADEERRAEILEGLAQYTGTVVAHPTPESAITDAIGQLRQAEEIESFTRTFAYSMGAAYGILLDQFSPGWTRKITATDDLGQLLAGAANVSPTPELKAAESRYGGEALREKEIQREAARVRRLNELRQRFVEGPVLRIPSGQSASFATLGLTPIPDVGTIFPQYRVSAAWGTLEADQVLVSKDGKQLAVPTPYSVEQGVVQGTGWKLTLADGWTIQPGARAGDHEVVPK
jgi:hypothetical protein